MGLYSGLRTVVAFPGARAEIAVLVGSWNYKVRTRELRAEKASGKSSASWICRTLDS